MKVNLLHATPLFVSEIAIRTCWNSHKNSDGVNVTKDSYVIHHKIPDAFDIVDRQFDRKELGDKDLELINRVGNKYKHSSTLEHITYSFYIRGISRALLQELARHRIASFSVKSTRYTLKKDLKNTTIDLIDGDWKTQISKFVVLTDNDVVNFTIAKQLLLLQVLVKEGYSNDEIKYALPEAFKVDLTFTINMRSLMNLLSLRLSKNALKEFRKLSIEILKVIPKDHLYLYEDLLDKYLIKDIIIKN